MVDLCVQQLWQIVCTDVTLRTNDGQCSVDVVVLLFCGEMLWLLMVRWMLNHWNDDDLMKEWNERVCWLALFIKGSCDMTDMSNCCCLLGLAWMTCLFVGDKLLEYVCRWFSVYAPFLEIKGMKALVIKVCIQNYGYQPTYVGWYPGRRRWARFASIQWKRLLQLRCDVSCWIVELGCFGCCLPIVVAHVKLLVCVLVEWLVVSLKFVARC